MPEGSYAIRTGNLFAGNLTSPYVNEKYNDIECSGLACDLTTADVIVTNETITTDINFSLNTGNSFSGTITDVSSGDPSFIDSCNVLDSTAIILTAGQAQTNANFTLKPDYIFGNGF